MIKVAFIYLFWYDVNFYWHILEMMEIFSSVHIVLCLSIKLGFSGKIYLLVVFLRKEKVFNKCIIDVHIHSTHYYIEKTGYLKPHICIYLQRDTHRIPMMIVIIIIIIKMRSSIFFCIL